MVELTSLDILSLFCSITGALIFLFAIKSETSIIAQLKKVKKPHSWELATFFTGFFFLGYVVNIVAILADLTELKEVFGALIFLLGAIFLVMVVLISEKTYRLIFEAAEEDLGEELELSQS